MEKTKHFTNKFIQMNKESLQKLREIDFENLETQNALQYISKLEKLSNFNTDDDIEKISKLYSKDNVRHVIDDQYFCDVRLLSKFLEKHIKLISQIVGNLKQIENEQTNIIKEINSKENEINEVIDNYSSYLAKNKNLLIRNEILHNFVQKINITKEEKDHLLTSENTFGDKFFKLIFKMTQIKEDIKILERNSEHFSKNLIFSIKENHNIIDELINEKIVIFLKEMFKNKGKQNIFTLEDYQQIIQSLSYLKGKENYSNFIIKEYSQMRKKNLEDQLRAKYIKIGKLDEIFKSLIEDFEFYFLKEFIILFTFFNNENVYLSTDEDHKDILFYLNYTNLSENSQNYINNLNSLMSIIKASKTTNDFNYYITYLNTILYVIEELFYQNISYHKNLTNSESNFAEMYKITILAYYYHSKIEKVLKINNFCLNMINENLNLFSMINNYKKSFSNILSKFSNEMFKNLQKLKKGIPSGNLNKNENFLSNNENLITNTIINFTDSFTKCCSCYSVNFSEELSDLNPKFYSSFKLLIEFFNFEPFNNEINNLTLLNILNLIQMKLKKLGQFKESCNIEDELDNLFRLYEKYEALIVSNLTSSILKSTKFEEILKNNISNEQTLSLIEHIMEKSHFYFLNLNSLSDFEAKEILKEKVKKEILKVYKDILLNEKNLDLCFFSEEEFKNYLEIL